MSGTLTKSQMARLKQIKAARDEAKALGQWDDWFRLIEDERWVLREGMR